MPSVGFEPTIPAGERPQTYALDRAATGTGALPLLVSLVNIHTAWLIVMNGRQKKATNAQT